MIAIIQDIRLTWTKRSRSGGAARARNQASRLYDVPPYTAGAAPLELVLHRVELAEESGFQPVERLERIPCASGCTHTITGFDVRVSAAAITVFFGWHWGVGAPERSALRRQVLTVRPGSWGQAIYNGRYTTMLGLADWHYHEQIVNIALVRDAADPAFGGEPAGTFRSLCDLR